MSRGEADPMKLFSTGKLKITGDVMASQKLGFLKKITPDMVKPSGAAAPAGGAAAPAAAYTPTVDDAFEVFGEVLKQNPDVVAKVGVVYAFQVGPKRYVVDLKNGAGNVAKSDGAAECTLELAEPDFLDLTQGKADPMKLFTTGKLKISGNIMASQKLQSLFKIDPTKAIEAVMARRGGGGGAAAASASAPATAAAAPAASADPNAPKFFAALTKRLADNKALAGDVRAKLTFQVKGPDAAQTFDLGGSTAATIVIADSDLPALAAGNIKSLYQHGKLRVDGDVSVAHRLGFLKGAI
jgi:3-hydroxyacyl-CoA dehydrogenase/3a,7a,12a-trihydroxy-5b-cholest-24-enoyl-CoA hydratase